MEEKNNTSLIQGRTWYWRNGYFKGPILSDSFPTRDLCLPVDDEAEARSICNELSSHDILAHQKEVHAGFAGYPSGQLVVFAGHKRSSRKSEFEMENIKRLEQYISSCGGEIVGNQPLISPSKIFSFFSR